MKKQPESSTQATRREEILRAAITVFSTRGYNECLVDHIAQEAGVAKGTLYLYFKSKQEMYLEAFRDKIERLHELSRAQVSAPLTTWEKIEAFVAVRLEFSRSEEDFLRIYLSEFSAKPLADDERSEQIRELIQRDARLLETIVREGIKNGEIRDFPAPQVVTILQHTVAGLVAGRLSRLWRGEVQPDLLIDLLRRGLEPSGD